MFEQLNVTQKFKNSIEQDIAQKRLPHAIILEGGDEELRLNSAKEIARAILCIEENKPCNNCRSCMKVLRDTHPDLHIVKKDEKSTMLKVDDIRNVKQKALLKPNDGDKSVFIISEAQYMNPQAQNALLKIFEEPEAHVNFILTTPSRSSLLETIISRGSAYVLGNIIDENKEVNEELTNICNKICNFLAYGNEYDIMTTIAMVKKDKDLFLETCNTLLEIIRYSLLNKYGVQNTADNFSNMSKILSDTKDVDTLLQFIEHLNKIISRFYANANFNILITEFACGFYK